MSWEQWNSNLQSLYTIDLFFCIVSLKKKSAFNYLYNVVCCQEEVGDEVSESENAEADQHLEHPSSQSDQSDRSNTGQGPQEVGHGGEESNQRQEMRLDLGKWVRRIWPLYFYASGVKILLAIEISSI